MAADVENFGISQVLTTIQFDCYLGFCGQQVHPHSALAVEWNGQFCVIAEALRVTSYDQEREISIKSSPGREHRQKNTPLPAL